MLACGCFLRISKSSLIINSWSLQITPGILSAFLHTVGPLVNVDGDGTGRLSPTWVLHLPPWTMLMPSSIGKSQIPEGLYNTVKACSHHSSLLFADPGIPWKSGPFLQSVYDSHFLALWSWWVLNSLWTSCLDHILVYCPPQRAFTYRSGWKASELRHWSSFHPVLFLWTTKLRIPLRATGGSLSLGLDWWSSLVWIWAGESSREPDCLSSSWGPCSMSDGDWALALHQVEILTWSPSPRSLQLRAVLSQRNRSPATLVRSYFLVVTLKNKNR